MEERNELGDGFMFHARDDSYYIAWFMPGAEVWHVYDANRTVARSPWYEGARDRKVYGTF